MEALYFLKFWRPTTHKENQPSSAIPKAMIVSDDVIDEAEEDSFFELELTVPDFDSSKSNRNSTANDSSPLDRDTYIFDSNQHFFNKADNADPQFQHPNELLLSKRKVLPIEPISKPPISSLKSAPRFRVLMFRKSKSVAEKTEFNGATQKSKKQHGKLFTVKFKVEEATKFSTITRENSLRRKMSEESLSDDSSKRFSMEVIQKYLKLIKPLYIKVSKKQSEKVRLSGEQLPSPSSSPATLPASSPKKDKQGNIPAGIRVVCKHLGKSKSASATTGVVPPTVSRRDDSLLVQHDGIQSAILHCKNSFHSSSRDNSLLSRFASDPLLEIPITSPRISSEESGIN